MTGVRIRLCIDAPELAMLPWELLYDRIRDSFLATSTETPLTRYISLNEPIRNLETNPPVRVLVVIPEASGLDVEPNARAFRRHSRISATSSNPVFLDGIVTRSAIRNALLATSFTSFTSSGTAFFDDNEGLLQINSEDGPRTRSHLGPLVRRLLQRLPVDKACVLNACQGAEVSATQPLAGVAPQIVRRGVPAVVAMQYPIADRAAVLFATSSTGAFARAPIAAASIRPSHTRGTASSGPFGNPRVRHAGALHAVVPAGIIFDLELPTGNAPSSFERATSVG